MTECIQERFEFAGHCAKQVVVEFDGEQSSTDGGALLLREVDRKLRLTERLGLCFADQRDQRRVEHSVVEMLRQRVHSLALGYEDLNDHEQLKKDPMLRLLTGKKDQQEDLAGKSTLNRLELSTGMTNRYKKVHYWREALDELLLDLFMESFGAAPEEIVLDLDATDLPLHGTQESRFFHGYYGHYCYLPLYIMSGNHVLRARLRAANQDASAGSWKELAPVVERLRRQWPEVKIIVRADSGFCREGLLLWCEQNKVDYVLGLARNKKLRGLIEEPMQQAREGFARTGEATRVFHEFSYRTVSKTWSRQRRVVAKAEYIAGKENPRFIVTSLGPEQHEGCALYERLYCARGEMENRIKDQMSLFADRMSTESFRGNQLRLYLSTFAYTLLRGLREQALVGTELAKAQPQTLRLKLLKIAATIRVTARKIWVSLPRSYPLQSVFRQAHLALRC
jgi:hypothetical protein